MIDFQITPRCSGKTTELIEMAKENLGVFFRVYQNKRYIKSLINIMSVTYSQFTYSNVNYRIFDYDWFYFDDFFDQSDINYDDIIELDKRGKNIIIKGTQKISALPPQNFLNYLKNNYPEYLI